MKIARMRMRIVRGGLLRVSAPVIHSTWWELEEVQDTVGGAVSYVNLSAFEVPLGVIFSVERFGFSMFYW